MEKVVVVEDEKDRKVLPHVCYPVISQDACNEAFGCI
jgi:hypothetical protein